MSAYYNEIDPYAAQWVRNLIAAGHIAPGDVDERSIVDVDPADLQGFTQCHFFAGIGIWSHSLRTAGWDDARPVWTGSCPCQPFSAAGKGDGYEDERHLWPHWLRLIRECRPASIFGEQVDAAMRTGWLDDVCLSLEECGYAVGAVDFPACSVGAPHIRSRLYFVAHANSRRERREHRALAGKAEANESKESQSWGFTFSAINGGPVGSNADGGNASPEREQRGGQQRLLADRCGEPRAVADDDEAGRSEQRQRGLSEDGHAQRRHDADRCGESDLVGHASSGGLGVGGDAAQPRRSGHADGAGIVGDADQIGWRRDAICGNLGDQDRAETQAGNKFASAVSDPGATNGFWAGAEWIACRDGKARPTEPGTFPLAHGATQRVGRLRAYGNAIVAPQAAAFIAAYMSVA